jgi:hypothetical protein
MFDGYCRLKPAERNALDQLLGEQRAWLDENTRFGAGDGDRTRDFNLGKVALTG